MNEPYDPTQQFLVSDLLSYSLVEHADLIQSVFLSAINEYDLELKFGKIRKFWEAREFKLAKHIPDSLFVKGTHPEITCPATISLQYPNLFIIITSLRLNRIY